jgi:K+-sensing histidine kinase KdpD
MAEFERQKKVLDMMASCHSILRDGYLFRSSVFENCLLVAAAILNSFVFMDAKFIERIAHIGEDRQKAIIGMASIIVFAISIVLLQVKWKEKASLHDEAANRLSELIHKNRTIAHMEEGVEKNNLIQDFNEKYAQVTCSIAKIPDKQFNYLKLRHNRKVEVSKLIDKYPGSFLLVLKVKLFISSFKEKS